MQQQFPIKNSNRMQLIGLITGAVVLIAGMGVGTFFTLKNIAPVQKGTGDANSQALGTADSAREKANELFAKGEFDAAKASYETALSAYTAEKNEAAANDVKQQLQVIELTIKNKPEAKQPKPKINVGGSTAPVEQQ
jgi:flagellar basal body-associated protein FliL